MSRELLSFIGGLGTGYMAGEDKKRAQERLDRQEERQAKLDEQAKQLHDRQMAEFKRVDDNRAADIEVTKPVEAKTYTQMSVKGMSAEEQQRLAEKMSTGEVEGEQAVSVGGKDFGTDKAAADAALAASNTPEAMQARRVRELRKTARNAEADQLEASIKQGKIGDMQLRAGQRAEAAAKVKEANDVWNTSIMESIKANGGDVHKGLTSIMSNSEIGGVKGLKFEVVENKDGTIQYISTDQSGKRMPFGKPFKGGEDGAMDAIHAALKQPVETQLAYFAEKKGRAEAQLKAAREAEMHAAKIKLMGAQGLHYARAGAAKAGEGQASAAFDPLQGFDPKEAQASATKHIDLLIANGAEMTAQQRADNIAQRTFALRDSYSANNAQRERARVFSIEARKAKSPQEIAALRERAAQSGYTAQEMAAIDSRFSDKNAK